MLLSTKELLKDVGEEAALEARGAKDRELAEGDALDGEELLGVTG